jgi:hypothetical protein
VIDAFSERFRVALGKLLPDLARELHSTPDGSLELRLPAPSGHGELSVQTLGEEVTIGFGPWHGHYSEEDWFPDCESPRGTPFERPLNFLVNFLRDLVVIKVWTKRGEYVGSQPFHWWYPSQGCREACVGDHYSAISWSGRGDMPAIPVDPDELRAWWKRMQ